MLLLSLKLLPFQWLHQKIIHAYHDSFPFPFQRLACSSQAVSHSETLLRDFTFWKFFFPLLRTAGLFFPNPAGLGAPAWARGFPGAIGLRIGFCKAKLCLFGLCLWLQYHCQKAMTGGHRSEGHWLHEILLTKQEDVVCSGSAAMNGENSKEKRNGKA